MKRNSSIISSVVAVCYLLIGAHTAVGQTPDQFGWADTVAFQYRVFPNITYLTANNYVVTGHSAGGHLSLTTGMIPASAGLDRQCIGGPEEPKVAAIINWFGITDVADLFD